MKSDQIIIFFFSQIFIIMLKTKFRPTTTPIIFFLDRKQINTIRVIIIIITTNIIWHAKQKWTKKWHNTLYIVRNGTLHN